MAAVTELVEDIYTSSETAIAILNDLLQFEHLDAGTFSLEQSWQPLMNLLRGKLNWAMILAEKKDVYLNVTDRTIATEYGPAHEGVVGLTPDAFMLDIESNHLTISLT